MRVMFGHPALLRAQLSFGAAWTAEWSFTVALGLVAFADGGATAVGLVAILRLVPAALLAPMIGAYADRMPRERVLIASSAARAVTTLAAAAVLAADGPLAAVYGLAALSTIAVTPFRAAHSALLPSLARTPEELTSVNAVRGMLDSLSVAIGPFVAAGLVAVADVSAVFFFAGALAAISAVLLVRLGYERPPMQPRRRRLGREVADGFRAVAGDRDLALVVGLSMLQTFTRGASAVFVVVLAIETLDIGEAGVGWLQGATGLGAIAGSVLAMRLVGSSAMARWGGLSIAMWGLPFAVTGLLPETLVAVAAFAVVGLANATLDVALFTVLARMARDEVLARVFGVFESLLTAAVALGSLAAPLAIDAFGIEGALVAIGLVAPAGIALAWVRLRAIDADLRVRGEDIRLLRRVPMLRFLPAVVIEQLARDAGRWRGEDGQEIFAAGEPGDAYYVVRSGRVVLSDGGTVVRTLAAGDGFGEIALLHDGARTLTARAEGDLVLHTLSRDDFVPAVSGFGSAEAAAQSSIARARAADAERRGRVAGG